MLQHVDRKSADDYLLEYCSYGCAYFVLENKEPHRASFDKNHQSKKLNRKKESRRSVRAIANKKDRFQKRERDNGQPAKNSKKWASAETEKNNEDEQRSTKRVRKNETIHL